MKVVVIIETGADKTYTAYIESDNLPFGLLGDGDTVKEAIDDFMNSYSEMEEFYKAEKKEFPNIEFEFKYDMKSFLNQFKKILPLVGLEALTGINQKQLGHYLSGHRKPSKKTTEKIEKKLHEFGEEISQLSFV